MKWNVTALILVTASTFLGILLTRGWAAEEKTFQTFEYATVRWAGRDNTHLIRPNGQVEMLSPLLSKVRRPDRTDERAYLMNIAINAVAKEGYELMAMTEDTALLKRAVGR